MDDDHLTSRKLFNRSQRMTPLQRERVDDLERPRNGVPDPVVGAVQRGLELGVSHESWDIEHHR